MGLNFNDIRFLLEWRGMKRGGSAATFGRQTVVLHSRQIASLRSAFSANDALRSWLDSYRPGDFGDDMLRTAFAFDEVVSIDISPYEGASVVCDIGSTLPHGLTRQFDLAIDGGMLEHVFNFPVGIANLMKLVRVGGCVYTQNPCNGLSGHGFYQFSPELLYRVFSESNGFKVVFVRISLSRTAVVEQTANQPVYDVIDPALHGARVLPFSSRPSLIMCLAERIGEDEPFSKAMPMQSDYLQAWGSERTRPTVLNWKGRLVDALPGAARLVMHLRNRRAFRRVAVLPANQLLKR
jgi:hypothetical protein